MLEPARKRLLSCPSEWRSRRRTIAKQNSERKQSDFLSKTHLASPDWADRQSLTFFRSVAPDPHQPELRVRRVLRFPCLLFWESKRASSPISNGASFLISLRWAKLRLVKICSARLVRSMR